MFRLPQYDYIATMSSRLILICFSVLGATAAFAALAFGMYIYAILLYGATILGLLLLLRSARAVVMSHRSPARAMRREDTVLPGLALRKSGQGEEHLRRNTVPGAPP
jgi:hypothetical protein